MGRLSLAGHAGEPCSIDTSIQIRLLVHSDPDSYAQCRAPHTAAGTRAATTLPSAVLAAAASKFDRRALPTSYAQRSVMDRTATSSLPVRAAAASSASTRGVDVGAIAEASLISLGAGYLGKNCGDLGMPGLL